VGNHYGFLEEEPSVAITRSFEGSNIRSLSRSITQPLDRSIARSLDHSITQPVPSSKCAADPSAALTKGAIQPRTGRTRRPRVLTPCPASRFIWDGLAFGKRRCSRIVDLSRRCCARGRATGRTRWRCWRCSSLRRRTGWWRSPFRRSSLWWRSLRWCSSLRRSSLCWRASFRRGRPHVHALLR